MGVGNLNSHGEKTQPLGSISHTFLTGSRPSRQCSHYDAIVLKDKLWSTIGSSSSCFLGQIGKQEEAETANLCNSHLTLRNV